MIPIQQLAKVQGLLPNSKDIVDAGSEYARSVHPKTIESLSASLTSRTLAEEIVPKAFLSVDSAREMIAVLILTLTLAFSVVGLQVIVMSLCAWRCPEPFARWKEAKESNHSLSNIPVLHIVGTFPVLEELVFRYILFPNGRIISVIAGLCWVTFVSFFAEMLFQRYGIDTTFESPLVWVPPLLFLEKFDAAEINIRKLLQKVKLPLGTIIYYLSAILFAACHITNYDFRKVPWPFQAFAVLPQFLVGLQNASIRMRFGIGDSMLMHSAYNSFVLLVVKFSAMLSQHFASSVQ